MHGLYPPPILNCVVDMYPPSIYELCWYTMTRNNQGLSLCVCVCLFIHEIMLVHCVLGRECNNCLRLIPECNELSVCVKYLANSQILCVCHLLYSYTI